MPVVLSVKAPLVLQPFCLTPKESSEVLPCHFPPHAQIPFFCVRVDTSLAPELQRLIRREEVKEGHHVV